MRTTVNLDDELLEEARRVTGVKGRTDLIHEGLRALIERESARRPAPGPAVVNPGFSRCPGGTLKRRDPGRYLGLDRPSALWRADAVSDLR